MVLCEWGEFDLHVMWIPILHWNSELRVQSVSIVVFVYVTNTIIFKIIYLLSW